MKTIEAILKTTKGTISFDDISKLDTSLGIEGNIEDLKEDLLQIEYPDDLLLDLGWYPSFDPEGTFQLKLIKDFDWEEPLLHREATDWATLETALAEAITIGNNSI